MTSVLVGSIFENTTQPPSVMVKLIYHWACQTGIDLIMEWVKVDKNFLRSFFTMLRSVCTIRVQKDMFLFGTAKRSRVEVGVITMGTTAAGTSSDKRKVAVDVLGVYDRASGRLRLQAYGPVPGETDRLARYARILEPLKKYSTFH